MDEKKQKLSAGTKRIIILAVIVIVLGLFIYFVDWQELDEKNIISNKESSEINNQDINNIKEANKNVIKQAQEEAINKIRYIDDTDNIRGNINAPVQLIIYTDFECPFCAQFSDIVNKIEEEFSDKVVIALRHYTLRSHKKAIPAAIAVECAGEQGKFWEMHDKLFDDNRENKLSIEQYKEDAKKLGLDSEQFNNCLDQEKYIEKINQQRLEAKKFGVNGTPASFVNGESIAGAVPFDDYITSNNKPGEGMKRIIERHL